MSIQIRQEFTNFLARAYELKSIADYGVDPDIQVSPNDARAAHDIASRFIATIAEILAGSSISPEAS